MAYALQECCYERSDCRILRFLRSCCPMCQRGAPAPGAAHAAAIVVCKPFANMQSAPKLLESRPQLLLRPHHALRQPAAFRTCRRQQSTRIRADLSDQSPALIDTVTSSVQTTADALSVSPTVLAAGIGAIGGPTFIAHACCNSIFGVVLDANSLRRRHLRVGQLHRPGVHAVDGCR
jgi:hypothetical protein